MFGFYVSIFSMWVVPVGDQSRLPAVGHSVLSVLWEWSTHISSTNKEKGSQQRITTKSGAPTSHISSTNKEKESQIFPHQPPQCFWKK